MPSRSYNPNLTDVEMRYAIKRAFQKHHMVAKTVALDQEASRLLIRVRCQRCEANWAAHSAEPWHPAGYYPSASSAARAVVGALAGATAEPHMDPQRGRPCRVGDGIRRRALLGLNSSLGMPHVNAILRYRRGGA
jgi:hypothetical protein